MLAGGVSEQADTTGDFATSDTSTPVTGAIDFTDIDLTDRPTAQITGQVVTWLGADHSTNLTSSLTPDEIAALKSATDASAAGRARTTAPSPGAIRSPTARWISSARTRRAKVVSTVTLDDDQGKTGTTDVTITITGKNDAPAITAETDDHSGADLLETNTELVKHGTLTVSDADATDHVTVAVDHLDIYLDGVLQTDYVGEPSSATLLNYLAVQPGDILDGSATHATFTWDFNSGSEAFDFLAAGHTLSLQYTIVPDDSHTPTGTGNGVLTFNIAGSNDAPALGDATLASVSGDNRDPVGTTVSDLFAGKFHDADDGASFQAVAVSADTYHLRSGRLAVRNRRHPSMGGYRIRQRHDCARAEHGYADPVCAGRRLHRDAGLAGRACDRRHLYRRNHRFLVACDDRSHGDGHRRRHADLARAHRHRYGSDGASRQWPTHRHRALPGRAYPREQQRDHHRSSGHRYRFRCGDGYFTVTLSTAHPDVSSIDLSPTTGSLDNINAGLANGAGITYDPTGASTDESPQPPATDQITLTVADSAGRYDTVNFIFNEAGDTSQGITPAGHQRQGRHLRD